MNIEIIRAAIKERLEKIVKEEIDNALLRASTRMNEAVTIISLELMEWYSVHDLGTHLEIRVSKREEKK